MISYMSIEASHTFYIFPIIETNTRDIRATHITVQRIFEQVDHILIDTTCCNPWI